MAASNNLEARVTALETQVQELTTRVRRVEQDARAARVLAGGADRDLTEIRADIRDFRQITSASVNAMREDITNLRRNFTNLRTEVTDLQTQMNNRFAAVDNGFIEMRGKFDATAAGMEQITNLLTTLIDQRGGPVADH
jgi:chromosome segregation ATPase